jgi:hypothetical protein
MPNSVAYHVGARRDIQASEEPTLDRRNIEAMMGYVAAMESADPTGRFQYYADDVVFDDWMIPGERLLGKDEVLGITWGSPLESLTEYVAEVHEVIIAGNIMVTLGHLTGRFTNDYQTHPSKKPIPATGKQIRWTFRDIYHFKGGKIVRIQYANDTLTVARQLGAVDDNGYPW